jgi:hypothetical protein
VNTTSKKLRELEGNVLELPDDDEIFLSISDRAEAVLHERARNIKSGCALDVTIQPTIYVRKRVYWGDIFLLFFLGIGSSLGSFISRTPSAMLADTFSVSMLSPNPIRLRNVENARSLCK